VSRLYGRHGLTIVGMAARAVLYEFCETLVVHLATAVVRALHLGKALTSCCGKARLVRSSNSLVESGHA
jgi:hypothetical protein